MPVNTPAGNMQVRKRLLKKGLRGRAPKSAMLRTKTHDRHIFPPTTRTLRTGVLQAAIHRNATRQAYASAY
jgi:hypothetical protein